MLAAVAHLRSLACRRALRRPLRRVLAWLSLAAFAPVLFACNARTVERPTLVPVVVDKGTVSLVVNRNVDLLFLIDDSSSMGKSQDNLRRNFPSFMTKLKGLPGGLPNVHIAIASSDMGAGSAGGCDKSKGGIFQYAPRGDCTSTGLEANATFISDINGVRNYNGNLEDVFTCMAALGEGGCGFENQFAAVARALGADGQPPPQENQGFLRPDAYLAIVMITNEDDCSASPGFPLYDISNQNISDPLGPISNFRCNEFGHICNGVHPDRHAPNGDITATVTYENCTSAEDGALLRVADVAAGIKNLKTEPDNQIMFAAISGFAAPYTVHWTKSTNGDTSPWPEISHSCVAADTSYADPSPRITQLVHEFGPNGLQLDICGGEFAQALSRIADKIADRVRKPCIEGTIAKKPGTAIEDCTVISSSPDGAGNVVERPIDVCAATGGVGPCWQLAPGEAGCTGQTIAVVPDPTASAPAWENAAVQCARCTPGVTDAARGCP
jgi:hypothetical protein